MATINVNIPDPVLARVLDAFASAYGYDSATDGTKAAFAKKQVARFIVEIVKAQEVSTAATMARDTAMTKASSEIVIS